MCLVTQLCPTLCDPMDCSPPGSSVYGDSPGKGIGVGCHALLQGIFPTQGSNPCLPRCRWILYHHSHKGSSRILQWVACPFSSQSFHPRNQITVSCIAGEFFTSWAIRKAPYYLCWSTNNRGNFFKKHLCLYLLCYLDHVISLLDSQFLYRVGIAMLIHTDAVKSKWDVNERI